MIVNMSMSALLLQSIPKTDVSLREGKQNSILYNNLKERGENDSNEIFVMKNRCGSNGQLFIITQCGQRRRKLNIRKKRSYDIAISRKLVIYCLLID